MTGRSLALRPALFAGPLALAVEHHNAVARDGTAASRRCPIKSCAHESRPRAALDAGGDQPVDSQPVAQQFEQPQHLLAHGADRGDVAGDGIGGLPELHRKRRADRLQGLLETVIIAEQPGAIAQILVSR